MLDKSIRDRDRKGICKTLLDDSVNEAIFAGAATVPKEGGDPAELPADSKALIRAVLETLPITHRRSQVVLQGIFRNKKWGYYPAHYRPKARVIEIAHPMKMGSLYRSMSIGTADSAFCKLDSAFSGRDASKWPEGRSAADSSFFLRNVAARLEATDNFYQYAFLHEFGHSIDHLIDFTGRFMNTAPFGNWVVYSYGQLEHMLFDMLQELGAPELSAHWAAYYRPVLQPALVVLEAKSHAAERPRYYCKSWRDARSVATVAGRPGLSNAAIQTAIDERLRGVVSGVPFPEPLRERFKSSVLTLFTKLDVAIGDPHLQSVPTNDPDGPGNVFGTRRFQFMSMYGRWSSYLNAAYLRRVSNYQFSDPGEWFPEAYSSLFGGNSRRTAFQRLDPDGAAWLHGCLCSAGFGAATLRGAGVVERLANGQTRLQRRRFDGDAPAASMHSDLPTRAHADAATDVTTNEWELKWRNDVLDRLRPGDVIMAYGFNGVAFAQGAAKLLKRVTIVPWLFGTGVRAVAGGGTLGGKGTANANHAMIVVGSESEALTGVPVPCTQLAHATNLGVYKSDIVDVLKSNYDTLRVFRRLPLPAPVTVNYDLKTVTMVATTEYSKARQRNEVTQKATETIVTRPVTIPLGAGLTAAAWSLDAAPTETTRKEDFMGYATGKAIRSAVSLSAYVTDGSAEHYNRYKLEKGGPPSTSKWPFGAARKKGMFCSMFVIACYHAAGNSRSDRVKFLPLDASATGPEMLDTYLRNSAEWQTILTASAEHVT